MSVAGGLVLHLCNGQRGERGVRGVRLVHVQVEVD